MTKKSFILHLDSLNVLSELTDEQAGQLLKAIYEYQENGTISITDFGMKMALMPFVNQFVRDDEKYQKIVDRNRNNGSKGGRPANPDEPKKPTRVKANPEKPTETNSDSVSENTSVKDSKKEKIVFDFKQSLITIGFDKNLVEDWLIVRKKKGASNTESALKGFLREVGKTGLDKNECLRICAEKSWQGLKAEWLKDYTSVGSKGDESMLKPDKFKKVLQDGKEKIAQRETGIIH